MSRLRDRNATSLLQPHKTIVILAAGLSTRYGTLKQLETVGPHGAALLDYSIFDALRAGFARVVLVVRSEIAAAMETHTTRWVDRGVEVSLVFQSLPHPRASLGRRQPWGTAHAVLVAARDISGTFAVCNADDFYGRDAFMRLANHLWNGQRPATSAIVGYRLAETLSEYGGVSRALCEFDRDGFLERIIELKNISAGPRGIRGQSETDGPFMLNGSEMVSTNLWGLTPPVVQNLSSQFETFMKRHGRDRKSEFLLSTAVNDQLALDAIRVRVLPTESRFLGITFPEDKPSVVESIAELIGKGHYPADLWAEVP